jgi:hypothetical protein
MSDDYARMNSDMRACGALVTHRRCGARRQQRRLLDLFLAPDSGLRFQGG